MAPVTYLQQHDTKYTHLIVFTQACTQAQLPLTTEFEEVNVAQTQPLEPTEREPLIQVEKMCLAKIRKHL